MAKVPQSARRSMVKASKQFQVSKYSMVNSFPLSTPTFAALRTLSDQSIDTQYSVTTQSIVDQALIYDLRHSSYANFKSRQRLPTCLSPSLSLFLSLMDMDLQVVFLSRVYYGNHFSTIQYSTVLCCVREVTGKWVLAGRKKHFLMRDYTVLAVLLRSGWISVVWMEDGVCVECSITVL